MNIKTILPARTPLSRKQELAAPQSPTSPAADGLRITNGHQIADVHGAGPNRRALLSKGRRFGPVFVLLAVAVSILAVGCSATADTGDEPGPPGGQAPPSAPTDFTASEFRVRSELVFATSADLSFQIPGEVGAVNVSVGDLVSAGDVLATLDTDTVTNLEHAEALAQFKVEQTQDELDRVLGLQSEDPLIRARAENALAKAEVALENAQDALEDYQLEHDVALGSARQRVADAIAALDRAEESVTDFADSHGQQFANALAARAQARTALDAAQDAVSDYLPLFDESVSKLRSSISQTEIAIDQSQESLRDIDKNHADRLSAARQNLALAETRLENAKDTLEAFHVKIVNEEFHSLPGGQKFDVVQLNALMAAVDTAQSAVDSWNLELTELAAGPKAIDRAAIETRIEELEATLSILNRRLDDALAGPDEDELTRLDANVLVAQERLNTAERELAEVELGVDQIELARLETAVESARIARDSAQSRLARLEDGPDPVALAALNQAVTTARETRDDLSAGPDAAAVALAHANVADALVDYADIQEDLEDTVIRAPFSGLVRLVTVDPDDVIRVDARIIQLVDPTDVAIRGLVETNYIERISVGTGASVALAAVPGITFDAAVESVSQDARTERGVISFPVMFSVVIPDGVQIPPNPGLVTTTVNPQNERPAQNGGPPAESAPSQDGESSPESRPSQDGGPPGDRPQRPNSGG